MNGILRCINKYATNTIDILEYYCNLALIIQHRMKLSGESTESGPTPNQPEWVELVRKQVNSLAFGVIQIIVHDSCVVQIERTEKVRLDRKPLES